MKRHRWVENPSQKTCLRCGMTARIEVIHAHITKTSTRVKRGYVFRRGTFVRGLKPGPCQGVML